jgi:AraC family transcriptional regulator, melibiose operon regulatory protein
MSSVVYERLGLDARLESVRPMRRVHHHQEIELNYLFSGRVVYLHRWRRRVLPVGRLVAFWGSSPHRVVEASPDNRMAWITLPMAWVWQWQLEPGALAALMNGEWLMEDGSAGEPPRFPMAAWVEEAKARTAAPGRALLHELQGALLRLQPGARRGRTAPASAGTEADPSWHRVEAMARFLTEHFTEEIGVPEVAAAASLHPKYALTLFRRRCGITLHRYLTQHRLSHAQRLLLTTDAKIIDIAYACGFRSSSAFYAAFEAEVGRPPAIFRRQLRGATSDRAAREES